MVMLEDFRLSNLACLFGLAQSDHAVGGGVQG